MLYYLIKHLHMTLAVLSLLFFIVRAYWAINQSPRLTVKWVKISPHVVDTLLLTCGVILMVLLHAWPHQTPWLAAKLIALVLYIGLGVMAIKRGRTPWQRGVFAVLAVAVFAYMVAVAVTKNPLAVPF